jgi:hypothetical protein
MTYRPRRAVTTPMPFPEASWRFGEISLDMHAVDEVLEEDIGVSDRDRRRLLRITH